MPPGLVMTSLSNASLSNASLPNTSLVILLLVCSCATAYERRSPLEVRNRREMMPRLRVIFRSGSSWRITHV